MKNSGATIKGELVVKAIYDDGSEDVLFEDHNHIVNGYLHSLSRLLTQRDIDPDPEEYAVNSLWVEASDNELIYDVSVSDSGPEGTVVHRHVFDKQSDVTLEVGGDPGTVAFTAMLDQYAANGETIRAVGLYTAGDDAEDPASSGNVNLVARQRIGAVDKTSDFAIQIEWMLTTSIDS